MRLPVRFGCAALAALLLMTGCYAVTLDRDLNLTPEMFAQRQVQTRRFDTTDEKKILATCSALLQDTGFTIDESDSQLGLLIASKERDASDPVQWALFLTAGIFLGVPIPPDKDQVMKAFVTTRPVGAEGRQVAVRVVFERTVFDTEQRLKKIEPLNDPNMYRGFFEKLSKALFLEAHEF